MLPIGSMITSTVTNAVPKRLASSVISGTPCTIRSMAMSWTTADIPDQAGRVAVVTGANGGLGLGNAKELAGAGAPVVMHGRNAAQGEVDGASLQRGRAPCGERRR